MKSARNLLLGVFSLALLVALPDSASARATLAMPIQTKIRHQYWHNAPHSLRSARFLPTMTMRKLDDLVKTVLKRGEILLEGKGTRSHIYTFPRSVGYNSEGQKSHSLKVITDEKGNVVNAYPV